MKFDGTEGDPFSTAKGYLNIHANGSANPAYGGHLRASDTHLSGFQAANAYWEAKIVSPVNFGRNPSGLFWLRGSHDYLDATGDYGEIDLWEHGTELNFHLFDVVGITPVFNEYQPPNITVPPLNPGDVISCWILPTSNTPGRGTIKIYRNGVLVMSSEADPAFCTNMAAQIECGYDPDATGPSADFGIQYIRCWLPQ
jgi:hypothetical protein